MLIFQGDILQTSTGCLEIFCNRFIIFLFFFLRQSLLYSSGCSGSFIIYFTGTEGV